MFAPYRSLGSLAEDVRVHEHFICIQTTLPGPSTRGPAVKGCVMPQTEPCPGCDLAEMLPSCCSMIFLQTAELFPFVQPLEDAKNLFEVLQVNSQSVDLRREYPFFPPPGGGAASLLWQYMQPLRWIAAAGDR
jgi:hypothetical protein